MDGRKIYKPGQLSQLLGVSTETLRKWAIQGKIIIAPSEGKQRRYYFPKLEINQRKSYIYARVSSSKQKNDLTRQINYIKQKFPDYEVIKDIGSGINFKRRGLKRVLELIVSGHIKELVVAHKDRLCRFGFELFEIICQKFGTVLTTLDSSDRKEPIDELTDDVFSILTVFSARYYGARKYSIL